MADQGDQRVPTLTLSNGAEVGVVLQPATVRSLRGGNSGLKAQELAPVLSGLATDIVNGLQGAKPKGSEVEFGLELQLESGALLWAIARGKATAHVTVRLTW